MTPREQEAELAGQDLAGSNSTNPVSSIMPSHSATWRTALLPDETGDSHDPEQIFPEHTVSRKISWQTFAVDPGPWGRS